MGARSEVDRNKAIELDVLNDAHAGMVSSSATMVPGTVAILVVYWWSANRIGLVVGVVIGLAVALPIRHYVRHLDINSHPNPRQALAWANGVANGSWAILPILMMPARPEDQYLVIALPFAMLVTNLAATSADRQVYLAGQVPIVVASVVAFAFFADGNTRWAAAIIAVTAIVALDSLAKTGRRTARRNAELQQSNDQLVRDLEAANAVLQHRSEHDELTGLPNRRALTEFMHEAPPESALSVIMVDLDRFKEVNDAHGHQFGDEILKLAATRLRWAVDDTAKLGRLGGDEFAIVWHQDPGAASLRETAAAINRQMREPFVLDGWPVRLSASVGVALGDDASDATDVLRRADIALYAAKAGGRDRAVLNLDEHEATDQQFTDYHVQPGRADTNRD